MLFNSVAYALLVFFTRVFGLITRRPAIFMLLGSVVFYFFAGGFDFAVFLAALLINWLIAKVFQEGRARIWVAVLFNIGLLGFFKYADFFLGFDPVDAESRSYIDIALPLGISFYTFQILAYHIDVVRGEAQSRASSFKEYALFISFFPQLVAGPIVRAHELMPQVKRLFAGNRRKVYLISFGLGLCVLGLFKKVFLADSVAPFVDEIFILGPESVLWAWLGAVLFSFQIYCDFSGYSDIAIGSAFLLGIRLPWNFMTPYLSRGPREFWQRWHITLSTWIRDYLYIPLGGSRGGKLHAAFVIVATMAIAGLWHGADWTFLIWGGAWGVYILLGRIFRDVRLPAFAAIALTYIVTTFLWVLFRAPDMDVATHYYQVMLGLEPGTVSEAAFYEERGLLPVLLFFSACLFALHILERGLHTRCMLYVLKKYQGPFLYGALVAAGFITLMLQQETLNPFIYFRF